MTPLLSMAPSTASHPELSVCPSCGGALPRRPQRKTACVHCRQPIYVRRGQLLAGGEQGLQSAPSIPLAAGSLPTEPTAEPLGAVEPSGTLEQDLERYASEFYHKHDLLAGKKLLVEVVGVFALGGVLLTALTSWLPPLGLTVGSGTIVFVMSKAAEVYADLDTEKRRQVRAVVSWVRSGFSLGDQLLDD